MKFYLCQTPDGPRYARTQLDAKALDPKFELVEHAVDQASLVALFNSLLDAAAQPPPVFTVPTDLSPEVIEQMVEDAAKPRTLSVAAKQRVVADRTWTQVELEEFIWTIPKTEEYRLGVIESVVAERRKELEAQV